MNYGIDSSVVNRLLESGVLSDYEEWLCLLWKNIYKFAQELQNTYNTFYLCDVDLCLPITFFEARKLLKTVDCNLHARYSFISDVKQQKFLLKVEYDNSKLSKLYVLDVNERFKYWSILQPLVQQIEVKVQLIDLMYQLKLKEQRREEEKQESMNMDYLIHIFDDLDGLENTDMFFS